MRFEWEKNEREEWRENYDDDKKEIHSKLDEIEQLNIKENLEHVKFLAALVENQSKEIEELKEENKKIEKLQSQINELKKINAHQNEEIKSLQSLKDDIATLSKLIHKNEENGQSTLIRIKTLENNAKQTALKLDHVDQIASRVSLQEADFNEADLTGQDMSGQDLSGSSFRNAKLKGTNFQNCNLSEADFFNADLTDANLSGATLTKANLEGVTLDRCNLSNTVVKGVILVVARTTQKKFAPDVGADAKVIWFSVMVNEVTGSCITPPNETNNEKGLPGKNDSPPTVRLNVVVLLLN